MSKSHSVRAQMRAAVGRVVKSLCRAVESDLGRNGFTTLEDLEGRRLMAVQIGQVGFYNWTAGDTQQNSGTGTSVELYVSNPVLSQTPWLQPPEKGTDFFEIDYDDWIDGANGQPVTATVTVSVGDYEFEKTYNTPAAQLRTFATPIGEGAPDRLTTKIVASGPFEAAQEGMFPYAMRVNVLDDDACFSADPVRYADGNAKLTMDDFAGLGISDRSPLAALGVGRRSWGNKSTFDSGEGVLQAGMVMDWAARLELTGSVTVARWGANAAQIAFGYRYQFGNPAKKYLIARNDDHESLGEGSNNSLVWTKPNGVRYVFGGETASDAGQLRQVLYPNGDAVQLDRSTPGAVYALATYVDGGATISERVGRETSGGRISRLSYERNTGNGWETERTVDYSYHGASSNSPSGTLREVVVRDGDANATVLSKEYYRWYQPNEAGGYGGSLKMWLGGESYLRATKELNTSNLDSVTDESLLRPYADNYFEYDSQNRVTKEIAQGAGCGCAGLGAGGQGQYRFIYENNTNSSTNFGPNGWSTRTTEILPDGTVSDDDNDRNLVYTNTAGQVIMKVEVDGRGTASTADDREYMTWYRYDAQGRQTMVARPSAVTGKNQNTYGDLIGYDPATGTAAYLGATGLVELTEYYTVTTTADRKLVGYERATYVQQGEDAQTRVETSETTYTDGGVLGDGLYYVASYTSYAAEGGQGSETTSYAYTWHTNGGSPTAQMQTRSTTRAAIVAAENGADSSTSSYVSSETFDDRGRLVWTKDADGHLDYYAHDAITGENSSIIRDVDPSSVSSPSVAPPTRGLGLAAAIGLAESREYDAKGRVTKAVAADGVITYTRYDDSAYDGDGFTQTKTYKWDAASSRPIGPVTVARDNPRLGFKETLTYSWPTTAGSGWIASGAPTGAETPGDAQSSGDAGIQIQSLTRTYYNVSGKATHVDEYFKLPSAAYTVEGYGAAGTNYVRTSYAYDGHANVKRVARPDGTLEWSVYDGLDRLIGTWKGTNDTGATNFDPTGGGDPDNNMVRTATYLYDANGNLTEFRAHFDDGNDEYYATHYEYDFRDRLTGKVGPDGVGEKYTLDNVGRQTKVERFVDVTVNVDGTLNFGTEVNGVNAKLRGKVEYAYDDQGRLYRTTTYEVDPTTGAELDRLTQDTWYDRRGNVIKTANANGLFQKTQFDGVGRVVSSYVSYDDDEATWAEADDVAGDTVISQQDVVYVGGRQALAATLDRTAATGSATGRLTPANSRLNASVTWYDAAGRVEYQGNYGTDPDRRVFGTSGAPVDANSDGVPDLYASDPPSTNTSDGQLFVILNETGYDAAGRVETTTDNKGRVTRYTYDLLGRRTKMVENAVGDGEVTPTTSADTNRTTEWLYDPWGRLNILRAHNPLGAGNGVEKQDTQYFYASPVDRSWVTATIYPDSGNDRDVAPETKVFDPNQDAPVDFDWDATGRGFIDTNSPNATDYVADTYDFLGRKTSSTDQRGVVHEYTYDSAGRLEYDTVTSLGRSDEYVDGSVRAIGYTYDKLGRQETVTSYADVAHASIANQVQLVYDGWGNVTKSYQSHSGAVNDASEAGADSPAVEYLYDDGAVGGVAKYIRLSKVTYPNGRPLHYTYGGEAANDKLNRVYEVGATASDTDATFDARYFYSGTQTIVRETRGNGTKLDYDPAGNGTLSGFDRFGRIVDQTWSKSTGTTPAWTATDATTYAYDANSNRTNRVSSTNGAGVNDPNAYQQSYQYDGLDRLTKSDDFKPVSGAWVGTNGQSWGGLDALGNWRTSGTDTNGDGVTDTTQTRTHNAANEITGMSGEGAFAPTYDAAGNMTTLPKAGNELVHGARYDAWNRLAKSLRSQLHTSETTVYAYDGLGRRISGSAGEAYFNESWQELELRNSLNTATEQNVWSQRYVDALVTRDVLNGTATPGTPATTAGTLDTSFGGTGKVSLNIDGTDYGRRVAIQSDGKILAVGRTGATTSTYDFAIVRYNADGTLDNTWGTGGVVRTSSGSSDEAFSVAVTSTGKVLVVGNVDGQIAVLRYNSNGTLDTTFDGDGRRIIPGVTWYTRNILLQADGKMILVGQRNPNGTTAEGFVLRLNADGSTDTTWNGGAGAVLLGAVSITTLYGVVLDSSGKIVVAGNGKVGTDNFNFGAARLNANGTLDTTFGTGGSVVVQFGAAGDSAYDLAIQSDGKIVLAGYGGASSTPYQNVFGMARLTASGALDTTFGTGGKVNGNGSAFAPGEAGQAMAVSIQPDGKIVAGGSSGGDFAIVRYNSNGTLDTSFGTAGTGRVKADFAGGSDGAYGMVRDAQGRFVLVGAAGADLGLARFHGVTQAAVPGTTGTQRQWVQQDGNFNVTSIADDSGGVLERYRYTPYGERTVLNAAGSSAVAGNVSAYGMQHGHQGGRIDSATGLVNFRNRDYSVQLGRWITRDRLVYVDGPSTYLAYRGSPLNALDGTGNQSISTDDMVDATPVGNDGFSPPNAGDSDDVVYRSPSLFDHIPGLAPDDGGNSSWLATRFPNSFQAFVSKFGSAARAKAIAAACKEGDSSVPAPLVNGQFEKWEHQLSGSLEKFYGDTPLSPFQERYVLGRTWWQLDGNISISSKHVGCCPGGGKLMEVQWSVDLIANDQVGPSRINLDRSVIRGRYRLSGTVEVCCGSDNAADSKIGAGNA